MVDTNSDPNQVDFPIPANDDASKSIAISSLIIWQTAIRQGLEERKQAKAEKEAAKGCPEEISI